MRGSLPSTFLLLLLLATASGIRAQSAANDQPLPDAARFLASVHQNVERQYDDAILLNGYTYRVKSRTDLLTSEGKVRDQKTEESDVINKDGLPLYKLVSKDGKPLNPRDAVKRDYKPVHHGPFDHPKTGADAIREAKASVDDLFRVMDFELIRREVVRDRSAIVVRFSPSKKALPQTQVGKMVFTRCNGEAWIDEKDFVLVSLRTQFIRELTYGTRLMVKIDKGTEMIREWLKFRDEVWLPSRNETRFEARIFLAKGFHFRRVEEFSDYKKFSSTSSFIVAD